MEKELGKRMEEERLVMRINKAKEKEENSEDDFKMEAIAELAAANNQLAEFYEGTGNFTKAKNNYNDAIQNYKEAIRLASKYGSLSSEHIYTELYKESAKALTRINSRKETGLMEKINDKPIIAASVIGLIGGTMLLVPTITGNAIGNISTTVTSFFSTSLLIIGLASGLLWFKRNQS